MSWMYGWVGQDLHLFDPGDHGEVQCGRRHGNSRSIPLRPRVLFRSDALGTLTRATEIREEPYLHGFAVHLYRLCHRFGCGEQYRDHPRSEVLCWILWIASLGHWR